MEDEDGGKVEYLSCPLKFITSNVNEFLEMRSYLEKYPHTAPAFRDQDPRYLAFDRYFTAKVAEFQAMLNHGRGV